MKFDLASLSWWFFSPVAQKILSKPHPQFRYPHPLFPTPCVCVNAAEPRCFQDRFNRAAIITSRQWQMPIEEGYVHLDFISNVLKIENCWKLVDILCLIMKSRSIFLWCNNVSSLLLLDKFDINDVQTWIQGWMDQHLHDRCPASDLMFSTDRSGTWSCLCNFLSLSNLRQSCVRQSHNLCHQWGFYVPPTCHSLDF